MGRAGAAVLRTGVNGHAVPVHLPDYSIPDRRPWHQLHPSGPSGRPVHDCGHLPGLACRTAWPAFRGQGSRADRPRCDDNWCSVVRERRFDRCRSCSCHTGYSRKPDLNRRGIQAEEYAACGGGESYCRRRDFQATIRDTFGNVRYEFHPRRVRTDPAASHRSGCMDPQYARSPLGAWPAGR